MKELIALAKAKPGQINYASGGSGASSHLAMELFKSMARIDLIHIPYKGTGPLITDLISGQVNVTIASAVPLTPQVKAGKLRGLAVTGPKRSPVVSRPAGDRRDGAGLRGDQLVRHPRAGRHAAGPSSPGSTRAEQGAGVTRAQSRLAAQGADVAGGTPEEFASVIRADFAKWAKVVKDSGARVD